MTYSPKQYAQALHQAIFESRPEDEERILDNFVQVLKLSGDLLKADAIEQEFLNYEREIKGIQTAEVISAKKLSVAEEQRILKELNAYVGGKVELKSQVQAGLVGGVVIKLGDLLLDGSVRRTLEDLKDQLVKP